ncbi:MAG: hypothetical protein AVDCRST_MAG67-2605, partial [uncultured Solirubrobacteraceae bacterium]
ARQPPFLPHRRRRPRGARRTRRQRRQRERRRPRSVRTVMRRPGACKDVPAVAGPCRLHRALGRGLRDGRPRLVDDRRRVGRVGQRAVARRWQQRLQVSVAAGGRSRHEPRDLRRHHAPDDPLLRQAADRRHAFVRLAARRRAVRDRRRRRRVAADRRGHERRKLAADSCDGRRREPPAAPAGRDDARELPLHGGGCRLLDRRRVGRPLLAAL